MSCFRTSIRVRTIDVIGVTGAQQGELPAARLGDGQNDSSGVM